MKFLCVSWETQLVQALDVRIGGRSGSPEPMEFLRAMLASGRMGALEATGDTTAPATAEGSAASAELCAGTSTGLVACTSTELGTSSRCPFSAVANRAAAMASIPWEPSAGRRLERVPEFIQPIARQGIERFAAEHEYQCITRGDHREGARRLRLVML